MTLSLISKASNRWLIQTTFGLKIQFRKLPTNCNQNILPLMILNKTTILMLRSLKQRATSLCRMKSWKKLLISSPLSTVLSQNSSSSSRDINHSLLWATKIRRKKSRSTKDHKYRSLKILILSSSISSLILSSRSSCLSCACLFVIDIICP